MIPALGALTRNPRAAREALGAMPAEPTRISQTPTPTDLPAGAVGLFRVTSTGRTSFWINIEGHIEEILGGDGSGGSGGGGARGPAVLSGVAAPFSAMGIDGDFYIQDRSADDLGRLIFGPKTDGSWPTPGWLIELVSYRDVPGLDEILTDKLDRRFLVKNGDPTASDIPAGTFRVVKNTAAGRISLYVNDGGTVVDLLAF